MKRVISLVLVLSVLVIFPLLFYGCNDNENNESRIDRIEIQLKGLPYSLIEFYCPVCQHTTIAKILFMVYSSGELGGVYCYTCGNTFIRATTDEWIQEISGNISRTIEMTPQFGEIKTYGK